MKYNLLSFKYFVDVVETQGFTPAAKRNFVSQTAISNSIKNLEKELNVKLIDRSTSHFKVTFAGEKLYHYVIQILNNYYEFNAQVSQLDNSYHTLRIHYLRGFNYWAINLAKLLKTHHTSLALQLDTENFSESITKLDQGDYDILVSFSTALSKIKNIHSQKIGTANFSILVNQNCLNERGEVKKEETKKQPLFLQKWTATEDNDVQTKILQILAKMKIDYSDIIYLNSFDGALSNVLLNQGMAIYPKELAIPGINDQNIRYLPNLPLLQYDVVAIYKDPAITRILSQSITAK
ncbi:MAG: LysR family transcriptional regulator [Lactobacillus panisapium]